MSYYGATICHNGHVMSKRETNHQRFCSKCGAETFSNCPKCGELIWGLEKLNNSFDRADRPYRKPYYCHSCSTPYPWTQKILDNAVELLSLNDDLSESAKELIKNSIPNLIVETLDTPIAIAKYRKGISSAGELLKNSLYQLLKDIVCTSAQKIFFP